MTSRRNTIQKDLVRNTVYEMRRHVTANEVYEFINTKDNLILKQGISKWNNGMQHNIPISATFTLFKYFKIGRASCRERV